MRKIMEILKDREYMMHLVTYVIFGILTTIVSLGTFSILRTYASFIEKNIANAISIVIAITFAYFTNRVYVFKSKEKNILKEYISFASSRGFTFVLDMATFYVFATILQFNEMIVKLLIQVAVIILNYIISRVLIFKEEKNNE